MKLPRWLVILMLTTSVLSVLAAAGWWWVTWPERTAREFVELIAAQRLDEANKIVRPTERQADFWLRRIGTLETWKSSSLKNESRTTLDLVLARQGFEFGRFSFHLRVERGKVILPDDEIVMWIDGESVMYVYRRGVEYGTLRFPNDGPNIFLEIHTKYSN